MRGDWESWLLPLSLFWMWWEPTPGAVEERQGVRTSSQPHQVHKRGLATGGKGLVVDRHPRCLGP